MTGSSAPDHREFLYKYRFIDERLLKRSRRIFTHNELYFPNAHQFNDPFDCKFGFCFDASDQEIRKYCLRRRDDHFPGLTEKEIIAKVPAFKEQLKSKKVKRQFKIEAEHDIMSLYGIFSLSEKSDDILMWSHYASSHKGFCLNFFLDRNDAFMNEAHKVIYEEEYPILNLITDSNKTQTEKSLLTKAKHWDYEAEWRIIDYKTGPGIKCFPPHLLVGVIFGCKMSRKHEDLIREWCKDRTDISFFKAREAVSTYALEIIDA